MQDFFQCQIFAVVGASSNRSKFGNKVLRCYQDNDKVAVPISKRQDVIEDTVCYKSLTDLCDRLSSSKNFDEKCLKLNLSKFDAQVQTLLLNGVSVDKIGVSIITPPSVSPLILHEGYALGIRQFFLQPGTIHDDDYLCAVQKFTDASLIRGCVLLELVKVG